MKKIKNILAFLMSFLCTASLYEGTISQSYTDKVGVVAFAENTDILDENDYDNFHWAVNADNQLVITPKNVGETAVISDFYTTLENPDPLAQEHYIEIVEYQPWREYNNTIESVIIGEGITVIGAYAFHNMPKLKNVYMSDSVERIYKKSFCAVPIENVHFSQNLKTIGESAFQSTYLTEVKLPENLGSIGKASFKNCKRLTDVTLSDKMKSISDEAFYGCDLLNKISLPDNLEKIGSYSFRDCINLTEIIIPDSVTSLSRGSFYGCSGLVSLNLGTGVTEIPWDCFRYCSSLTNIVLDENIIAVGKTAFSDCSSLNYVYTSSELEKLEDNSFYNCPALEKFIILNPALKMPTMQKIGDVNKTDFTIYGISGSTAQNYAETFGIPFEVYGDIGDNVYSFADNLNWTIKNGTLIISGEGEIPDYTFTGDSLTKDTPWAIFASEINAIQIDEGITRIGNKAFIDLINAKEVILPSTLKSIGAYAFQRSGIQKLTIPENVTEIGEQALRNCTDLVTLVLPGTLESIPTNMCGFCTSLKTVSLSDGIKIIGDSAFSFCTSLEDINFPATLETIKGAAFNSCTSLRKLLFSDNLKSVETSAFYECSSLTEVNFGNGIEEIGSQAFSGSGLSDNITIPASVIYIGGSAFLDCPQIKSFTVLNPKLTLNNLTYVMGYANGSDAYVAVPTTIYGFAGSKTQVYAYNESAFTFVAIETEFEKGDINFDGSVSIADAVVLQKYLMGSTEINSLQMENADINSDNSVDVFDMVLIRHLLVERMD